VGALDILGYGASAAPSIAAANAVSSVAASAPSMGAVAPAAGFPALTVVAVAWTLIDKLFIMPHLMRANRQKYVPPRFIDMTQSTANTGSPRVYAIGPRVRVPGHLAWIVKDTTQRTSGSSKTGKITTSEIHADAGIVFNDRESARLLQLIVQSKLCYWDIGGRNIYFVQSSRWTFSIPTAGTLRISTGSYDDVAFGNRFAVNDVVRGSGFSDADKNKDWFVSAVTGHTTSAKSYIELQALQSQTVDNSGTSGTVVNPAKLERVDDSVRYYSGQVGSASLVSAAGSWQLQIIHNSTSQTGRNPGQVFRLGDLVSVSGMTAAGNTFDGIWSVFACPDPSASIWSLSLLHVSGATLTTAGPITLDSAPSSARIFYHTPQSSFPGMFTDTPVWHPGAEDEAEDDTLLTHQSAGTVPAYRGQGLLSVNDMLLTDFGNSLTGIEGLVEADSSLTYAEAIARLCERCGIDPSGIDVSLASSDPCHGYFFLGAPDTVTALSPLLLATHTVTQERDDVLAFFAIENADVQRIRNGADFSDLGCYVGQGSVDSKIRKGQTSTDRLPTSVNVYHQDPDSFYTDGLQPFGARNPTGDYHDAQSDIDARTLVLTRQEAQECARKTLRRVGLNSDTFEFDLPASYVHIVENDIVTVTDDDGEVLTMRVVEVNRGQNFLVHIVAVRESLTLSSVGSPVQTGSGQLPVLMPPVLPVNSNILDIPALFDVHAGSPGLWLAAWCSGVNPTGVRVMESRDGGTEYEHVATLTYNVTAGYSTDALATGTVSEVAGSATVTWDTSGSVNISVDAESPLGTLATVTATQVTDQRMNWAMLGDEMIGFRDVTAESDGTYTLSYLLRGLRGTGAFVGTHAAGDRFTLLYGLPLSAVWRDLSGIAQVGATLKYKFLAPGAVLGDVDAVDVVFAGWNSRPMPVYSISIARNTPAANDITFTCAPWSRLAYPLGSTGPYAFGESSEEYVWKVYSDSGYTTLKATLTDTSVGTGSSRIVTRGIVYTAAEQTTDSFTHGATAYVEVYQNGDNGTGRTTMVSG